MCPKKIRRVDVDPKRSRRKRLKRLFFLAVFVSVGILCYLQYLEYVIEKKFGTERRWYIPSRVYADAEYLYPGVDIKTKKLVQKLERLNYKNTGSSITGRGDFFITKDRLEIYLHDFSYPQEQFRGFPIRIQIYSNKIESIQDIETGESLNLIRLEPEEVATIFDEKMEDRTPIHLSDCPPHFLDAVILLSEERFFNHKGIDPIAITRAMIKNLLALRIVEGGSTLTQQLVKNFFLTSERSFLRKANEAFMALLIEQKYSKPEILEAYLNEIYLGQRGPSSVMGVAEASKHYFGKEIHQITLGEAALLAGSIRSPNAYSPSQNSKRAMERRNFILGRMLENELISEEEYNIAIYEKITAPKQKLKPIRAPYFIDFVKWQLADFYPPEVLETEGLKIFTTLDMTSQATAEQSLEQGIKNLETQWASILPREKKGELEGCLVSIQPQNGYVRAMAGGKNYAQSQFNRCTQSKRQPGSIFKPFVYLTAFDSERSQKIFTPASLIEDTHFEIQTVEGPWSPKNYDEKEHGIISLRQALEQSYNIATAKLALEVGLENIVQTARDAGMTSPMMAVPSLALGAFEVTPLEIASSYTIFPNNGLFTLPISIVEVTTQDGKILEKKTFQTSRRFSPNPVALTNTVLKGVFEHVTAQAVKALGFEGIAAGKTGTTSDYRDSWFVGFTPELLALAWVGYDDNTTTKMSGARG